MPRLWLQVVGLLGVNFSADFRSQSVFSRLAEIAPARHRLGGELLNGKDNPIQHLPKALLN
jgi:hypothetical protein